MNAHRSLSVVIPAFNEEERLGRSLDSIYAYLQQLPYASEVIVVDDGSGDGTYDAARRYRFQGHTRLRPRVVRNGENRGKGFSVRRGVLEAGYRYVLLSDADLSTPIQEFAKLESSVVTGPYDLAFGSRDLPSSKIEVHQPLYREKGGKVFNWIMWAVTGLPYRDTQCGFKLFDLVSCRPVFERQTVDRYAFDVELIYLAHRLGLRVAEIPVVWRHSEGSKVRFWPDFPASVLELSRIRWNDWKGRYKIEQSGPRS